MCVFIEGHGVVGRESQPGLVHSAWKNMLGVDHHSIRVIDGFAGLREALIAD
jgi:hypothetical protein